MIMKRTRVRFAPSPTGPLHIGGVRTALYNYLFARQNGGDMILRIEDTDSRRFVPGAEDYINESLKWLGIGIDEGVREGGAYGPYKQSERRDIYRKYAKQLLDDGKAYIAFDSPEELEAARAEHPNFQYDAHTRMNMRNSLTLLAEEVKRLIDEGNQYVVRIKIEPDVDVHVNDLIRGEVVINSNILDDKVLYKSADDLPTYHLANIVDDHLMEVTHVIRGEEWLPSAPLHVLLYRALGWEDSMPQFVHLPLLLKPVGNGKLSKRDGDKLGFPVFPLEWHDPASGEVSSGYREKGYLPEAVVNFLALLGWNPGDDSEIMSMDELIRKFSFEHCSKAGAKFDYKKGIWFNHEYLMRMDDMALAELFMPILKEKLAEVGKSADDFGMDYVAKAVGMVKGRIEFVQDLWTQGDFFFLAPTSYAEKDVKKRWQEDTPRIMEELCGVLEGIDDMSSANAEKIVLDWIASKGYHLGNVMNAFRLAVVGACRGPHMFDITELMPKSEVLARVKAAVASLG
ncbi:MAG: glutamate--tRNA ligase [Muribaculum sp.]|nr:glutamate--tRNA ligase [Muribaculum sp.]